ncbi:MAG: hypothetical protein GXY83_19860 [Rhodopirellula sp.]|nr:hypothetical protein [Rhodopirellula sp.]
MLLDNTDCAGILSADGHSSNTTAMGTHYLEKLLANWPAVLAASPIPPAGC